MLLNFASIVRLTYLLLISNCYTCKGAGLCPFRKGITIEFFFHVYIYRKLKFTVTYCGPRIKNMKYHDTYYKIIKL